LTPSPQQLAAALAKGVRQARKLADAFGVAIAEEAEPASQTSSRKGRARRTKPAV
jgi:NAD-dependent oxidoreductase involved in siderophore biosynthesis